jgi:hypothetical protein
VRLLLLALLTGCATSEQSTQQIPEVDNTRPVIDGVLQRPVETSSATVLTASGKRVVDVVFEGVGSLHQGFFMDLEAITQLSQHLMPCFDAPSTVKIGYEAAKRRGWIIALMDKGNTACQPHLTREMLDLTPLTPIGKALAGYRDAIAASYDVRIASFEIGLLTLNGPSQCVFWNAGQYPPDGTLWDRCMTLGTQQVCAESQQATAHLRFSKQADAQRVARCFGG